MRGLLVAASIAIAVALGVTAGRADTTIPGLWSAKERVPRTDVSGMQRLRFLTTVDFPPLNFLDPRGRLTGFHVDLARAICRKLELRDRCQIQALPWDEIEDALERGDGEAIISGLAISERSRGTYLFSRPYLGFPGRFAMRRDEAGDEPLHERLEGRRVGVIDNTTHELFLRDFFQGAQVVTYSRADWMRGDLEDEGIDAVFGDGMQLSRWLARTPAEGCCTLVGGPYLAPEYFGHGLAIAVPDEAPELAAALNYALREIDADGTFAELYLRYFPVGFY